MTFTGWFNSKFVQMAACIFIASTALSSEVKHSVRVSQFFVIFNDSLFHNPISAYDYSIGPMDKAIVKTDIQIAVPNGYYGRVGECYQTTEQSSVLTLNAQISAENK